MQLEESTTLEPGFGELYDPQNPSKGKHCPFHEHQQSVLFSNQRFIGAVAGTGGGKTVVGAYWSLLQCQKAIQKLGSVFGMIVAPTYKVLSRATMPTFVAAMANTELEGKYLESKNQYILPNGWGTVWCQGADNPGGLEGGQFDFVWGDEGGQFKKATFEAITGRTGARQAPILITTTPYGLGELYNSWYKNYLAGDEDYHFRIWNSVENPAYPQEEYERAKKRLSPEKFAERYQGKFMRLEGLVYPDFHKVRISMNKDELKALLSTEGKLYGGIDFGWNDPFCALSGFLQYSTNILYIWYERYKSQTTIDEHAKTLPKEVFGKRCSWSCDSANPEQITKLKRGGHKVRKAKKHYKGTSSSAIINGILMVNARIYNGSLKVLENCCPALCGESEVYRYPEKDESIVGDKPIDEDNHAMDALRYMVTELDWKKAA